MREYYVHYDKMEHNMQFNQLSKEYTVSGQIAAHDIAAVAAKGFRVIICNRPDHEVPDDISSDIISQAATAAGLQFHNNPFDAQSFCQDHIDRQANICATCDGPVFAYCATGNRCSIIWAFTQAARTPAQVLINTAANVGYNIGHLQSALEAQFTANA